MKQISQLNDSRPPNIMVTQNNDEEKNLKDSTNLPPPQLPTLSN